MAGGNIHIRGCLRALAAAELQLGSDISFVGADDVAELREADARGLTGA